ncbi:MAG: C45 family peptidase, partial [Bacteroidales bacterium]|nr:C45 family peptidase [Bacteroidales bacterium]
MKKRYITLIVLLACIAGLVLYARSLNIPPPVIVDMSCTQWQRVKVSDSLYVVGNNWLHRSRSGLWEMCLEGNGFERGVAFGKLTRELLEYQEDAFVEMIGQYVPSTSYLRFLKYFVAWFNRKLPEYVPQEYLEEIYGTSLSASPRFDFIASPYLRQLNYHAAHDIGHALQNMNMVGCTSFALWNGCTTDSSLVVGRNFDFYAGERFAENKIVCFIRPDSGYRFTMVGWADMCGVLSGMNEKGLTVTINAAKSGIPTTSAMPVSLLAREMLQYAATIDEAYAIAAKRSIFVSESFLIGSCADNRASAIEKTPDKQGLFSPAGSRIICTNHFQSDTFSSDAANLENIRESDSPYRLARASELLAANPVFNETGIATVLRDTRGLGGKTIGYGNEKAINQLIAHHTVIFKPAEQKFWVSTHPYQLGEMVAYNADSIFAMPVARLLHTGRLPEIAGSIPADSLLYSPDYAQFLRYRQMCDSIRTDMDSNGTGKRLVDERFVRRFVHANPEMFQAYRLLGDWHQSRKEYASAV